MIEIIVFPLAVAIVVVHLVHVVAAVHMNLAALQDYKLIVIQLVYNKVINSAMITGFSIWDQDMECQD
tara:strand:+ start:82 stop:285 length:204 start_codon:yes stop_codon:yes gene_type:complete